MKEPIQLTVNKKELAYLLFVVNYYENKVTQHNNKLHAKILDLNPVKNLKQKIQAGIGNASN